MRLKYNLIEKKIYPLYQFYELHLYKIKEMKPWLFGRLGERMAVFYLEGKKIKVTTPPNYFIPSTDEITNHFNSSIGKIIGIFSNSKSEMVKINSFEEYNTVYLDNIEYSNKKQIERIKNFFISKRLIKLYVDNLENFRKLLCNSLDFLGLDIKNKGEPFFIEVKSSLISCSGHQRKGKIEISTQQRKTIYNLLNNDIMVFIVKINFCLCEKIFLWYTRAVFNDS